MGKKKETKSSIVVNYLEKYPAMSSMGLARLLSEQMPDHFTSVESARGIIRYVRGAKGEESRKDASANYAKYFQSEQERIDLRLPESYAQEKTAYQIPTLSNKILVASDFHVPYQDNRAIEVAFNYAAKVGVNCVVLNGDVTDFHQISRWEKDKRKRDTVQEIEATREFLEEVSTAFSGCHIVMKEGNHDERLPKYMRDRVPELADMFGLTLPDILGLDQLKINHVSDKRVIRAGKLNILHGHEYFGSGGTVNPARNYYMKAEDNIMVGHVHRTSQYLSKPLSGGIHGAWTVGCMCELMPDYMPYNKHNHGFAIVEVYEDGNFHVDNKMIIDGKLF